MIREDTGIGGLNSMIEGGLPQGSVTAISGPPGVGKSIMVLHFLLSGARKGQKSLYLNLEEPRTNISRMISQFEFKDEFLKYEAEGLINITCMDYIQYEDSYSDLIKRIVGNGNIKRLVIDSFNCFFSNVINPATSANTTNVRRMIHEIFKTLRREDLTTLLILESNQKTDDLLYNIPYLVDGHIKLDFISLGTLERRMFIPKMRWTKQSSSSKPFELSAKGIEIFEDK